jgi:hypothetical protein
VYEQVKQGDLFVGSQVTVYGKQLKLTAFGDQFTTRALGSKQQRYASHHSIHNVSMEAVCV